MVLIDGWHWVLQTFGNVDLWQLFLYMITFFPSLCLYSVLCFASVVVMYPLRVLLWAKPAPHTHLVPSPGLLSWGWHNHHRHPIRRCQTWANTSTGITFIATTGRHWTQTSLKHIYWENCLKIYLSTDQKKKKNLTETVILCLQNLTSPGAELPTYNSTASRGSTEKHLKVVVCNIPLKGINLPGTTRTASWREVIASGMVQNE